MVHSNGVLQLDLRIPDFEVLNLKHLNIVGSVGDINEDSKFQALANLLVEHLAVSRTTSKHFFARFVFTTRKILFRKRLFPCSSYFSCFGDVGTPSQDSCLNDALHRRWGVRLIVFSAQNNPRSRTTLWPHENFSS